FLRFTNSEEVGSCENRVFFSFLFFFIVRVEFLTKPAAVWVVGVNGYSKQAGIQPKRNFIRPKHENIRPCHFGHSIRF
ncbi:hypothetical protein, partial [Peribacillus psychrosaccharolyticus]|uniref:hypothetical protein n=1 Tax=Peribacillus psychrosaccharolyticus TaxID=1407 RepID=UPI001F20F732